MTILSAASRSESLLVCFSQLRWGFVVQRPQHLMRRAAMEYRVVFWEEPIFEGDAEPHLARFVQDSGVEVITPKLAKRLETEPVTATLRTLLDNFLRGYKGRHAVSWYITPAMLPFSAHLKPDITVYDNMDELTAFHNAPAELIHLEKQLLRKADVVFTGGMSIYEAKRHRHTNIHAFPSSIDKDHFARARHPVDEEPADQADIPRKRIGWFGVIDERFDAALVRDLAERRPDWQFVMLGPIVKIDPVSLPRAANIHWLGGKHYNQLPDYMSGWDAGLIPFAINEATRFISPTKTPEYLAAGVPVVATPIRDIIRPYGDRGLVEIASTAEEVDAALTHVMTMLKGPWLAQVDQFLSDQSWDNTWANMQSEMGACTSTELEVEAA